MEMFFILYAKREARMELREVTDGVFKRKFNKSGRRISLENYTPWIKDGVCLRPSNRIYKAKHSDAFNSLNLQSKSDAGENFLYETLPR